MQNDDSVYLNCFLGGRLLLLPRCRFITLLPMVALVKQISSLRVISLIRGVLTFKEIQKFDWLRKTLILLHWIHVQLNQFTRTEHHNNCFLFILYGSWTTYISSWTCEQQANSMYNMKITHTHTVSPALWDNCHRSLVRLLHSSHSSCNRKTYIYIKHINISINHDQLCRLIPKMLPRYD